MLIVEHALDNHRHTRVSHCEKLENYFEEMRLNYVWIFSCVQRHCERQNEGRRENKLCYNDTILSKSSKKMDKFFHFVDRLIDIYPENKSNGQYWLSCCICRSLTCENRNNYNET